MLEDVRWFKKYLFDLEYKKAHGNCNMKGNYVTKDGIKLGAWYHKQRNDAKKGKLSDDKLSFILGLEPELDIRKTNWEEMYSVLKDYYTKNGNSNVPTRFVDNENRKIGQWVNNQRKGYYEVGNCVLTKEKIAKLNMLEFDWSLWDTSLLNRNVTDDNKLKYKTVMLDRMKHILEDLSYEIDGEITDVSKQKSIEKEIIKRMWR